MTDIPDRIDPPDPAAGPDACARPGLVAEPSLVAQPGLVARQRRWHAYYTQKRIVHQWLQVHLLKDLPVQRVLEIGPYHGLVTAMLANAGYTVTTLDISAAPPPLGASGHIRCDIRRLDPARLGGFDVILCCETLEHIHWPDVDGTLAALAASRTPWLVVSVPFEGTQLGVSLYWNRHALRQRFFLRKFRWLRRFRIRDDADFDAHKWEIGYRGHPLAAFRDKLAAAGWEVERQDFTEGCRSVFLVCRNRGAGKPEDQPAAGPHSASSVST